MSMVRTRRHLSTSALVLSTFALLALVFALSGCAQKTDKAAGTDQAPTRNITLQIFAANSLEKALPEVQKLYTKKKPEVTFADSQFKASGDLVEQLRAGAAGDLLITASSGTMDKAAEASLVASETRRTMFANDLVVVTSEKKPVEVTDLKTLTGSTISKIAIGDAKTVPAGAYANQALASVGLYSDPEGKAGTYDAAIASKVVLADKVGTAAQYVATGDCQVGFVYSSDVFKYEGIKVAFKVPAEAHKDIVYPGAVVTSSQNAEAAAEFLDYCMNDADAQAVWARYGFQVMQ